MISDFIEDSVHGRRRTITFGGISLPWPFPIVYQLHGSSAMVFGVPVFGGKASWFIKSSHKLFRRISNARYWLLYRFHPSHKYHLINTGLGYGFHEHNERLLHGAMVCLIEYIEECKAAGVPDPGEEALAIYHWWQVQRPADQAQHDQWMTELYSGQKIKTVPLEGTELVEIIASDLAEGDRVKQKAMWDLEQKIRDDEQAYLHRLINIRLSMSI